MMSTLRYENKEKKQNLEAVHLASMFKRPQKHMQTQTFEVLLV